MDSNQLIEIARNANAMDIVDWIERAVAAAGATEAQARSKPIETPVGQLIPGRFYKIWVRDHHGKERVLRHVVPRRKTWTENSFEVIYPKTNRTLHIWGVNTIIKIEDSTPDPEV